MFFYFCKVLFSDFLQFNGNFVDAQNNSEYRDWAPLTLGVTLRWTSYSILSRGSRNTPGRFIAWFHTVKD